MMLKSNVITSFSEIPVVNLQAYSEATPKERADYINHLRDVCHCVGFFYLTDHGIPSHDLKKVLAYTKHFFDLPQQDKDALAIHQSPHYRGYGKLGEEVTLGVPDFKETFDLGYEQAARTSDEYPRYFHLQGPNQWPSSPDSLALHWRETIMQYLVAVHTVGMRLMRLLALTLNLPEDFFSHAFQRDHEDAYTILRLLRYPPSQKAFGVGPHTDVGCLVLLLQDEVGGLQVQNSSGDWIDAPPLEGALVVNIGEMLELWSNHYFKATPHRVLNASSRERYSVPFFLEPGLATVVEPIGVSGGNDDKDQRIIYGEHMLRVYERSFVR